MAKKSRAHAVVPLAWARFRALTPVDFAAAAAAFCEMTIRDRFRKELVCARDSFLIKLAAQARTRKHSEPVTTMHNIGPRCAEWLAVIGIHTADDLRRLGAPTAYRELVARGVVKPHRMLLYALGGAVEPPPIPITSAILAPWTKSNFLAAPLPGTPGERHQ